MSAQLMFWYKRYDKVAKTDNKGKQIGVIMMETEDCFNLYEVIRGYWADDNVFIVRLKDAHEESREIEMHPQAREERIRRKESIPKERVWVMSQIELIGEDIRRFRAATELLFMSSDLPTVKKPTPILPFVPKAEVTASTGEGSTTVPTTTNTQPGGMTVVRQEAEPVIQTEEKPAEEPTLTID